MQWLANLRNRYFIHNRTEENRTTWRCLSRVTFTASHVSNLLLINLRSCNRLLQLFLSFCLLFQPFVATFVKFTMALISVIKPVNCVTFNVSLLWVKCWFVRFENRFILFLFASGTAFQPVSTPLYIICFTSNSWNIIFFTLFCNKCSVSIKCVILKTVWWAHIIKPEAKSTFFII